MATLLQSIRTAGPKKQLTVTPGLTGDALAASSKVEAGYAWRTIDASDVPVPLSDFADLDNIKKKGYKNTTLTKSKYCPKKGERHADDTVCARKLLVHSECPSEMHWYYKAPKVKDPIEIAVANYPPGLVMACMYDVNSMFVGHRISHEAISTGNKRRYALSLDIRPFRGSQTDIKLDTEYLGQHFQNLERMHCDATEFYQEKKRKKQGEPDESNA